MASFCSGHSTPHAHRNVTDRPVFRYIPTGISLDYQTNWILHEAWTPRCLSSLAKNGRPSACVCRSRFPPRAFSCRSASGPLRAGGFRTRMAVDELTVNPKRRCLRLSRRLRSRSAASRQTAWGLVSRTISLDAGNLCRGLLARFALFTCKTASRLDFPAVLSA